MSVNLIILIGNLGDNPKVRETDYGKVTNFSLATSETFKNSQGEKITQTEWHNIVLWKGLAEIAEKYLKKGSQVYIKGRIKTRSYEKDGEKKYITEIIGDEMKMLGKKEEKPADEAKPPEQTSIPEKKDDLPF